MAQTKSRQPIVSCDFMKTIVVMLISIVTFLFVPRIALAEEAPTPTPPPQVQYSNEFSVQNEPSSIITLLKGFIEGFDSLLGGFIFYTPDPFADSIKLKDDSTIPGVTKYRNVFHQIAIPILAIVIAVFAVTKIGSDNTYELKSFAIRFIVVIALFITVPTVLSYTIQFNNLLVKQISETQNFTGFLNDYFDKSQEAIANNENSEKFGIPSFDVALQGGIFRSLGKFIVQIFLFAITFLFMLCGFLYLGYQFVIRFATLLFLGVIYPIVIPFALTERTQTIVQTYFKTWFTFLIQQPAFALGFAISTDIFASILQAQGPSVGLLFFYTGFLFFLGGVNMLVAKIFGDVWTAMSGNMIAAVSSRAVGTPISSSFKDFKNAAFGKSLSATLGNKTRNLFASSKDSKSADILDQLPDVKPIKESTTYTARNKKPDSEFATNLSNKGFGVTLENAKQGIVSVSGGAYKYEDNRTGLTTYYPTMTEGVQDGIPEDKLQHVNLEKAPFIDLSTFDKTNPNPHTFNAMQKAQKEGKEIDFAYVNKSSPPHKIKNFLELSQSRNEAYGIKGVIAERQAKNGSDSIIRMYSHKNYEKRKNI